MADLKTKKIEFLVSEKDFNTIQARADKHRMDRSEFIRFCSLNSRISVDVGSATNSDFQKIMSANKMFEDGKINEEERNRIVSGQIDKILKTT